MPGHDTRTKNTTNGNGNTNSGAKKIAAVVGQPSLVRSMGVGHVLKDQPTGLAGRNSMHIRAAQIQAMSHEMPASSKSISNAPTTDTMRRKARSRVKNSSKMIIKHKSRCSTRSITRSISIPKKTGTLPHVLVDSKPTSNRPTVTKLSTSDPPPVTTPPVTTPPVTTPPSTLGRLSGVSNEQKNIAANLTKQKVVVEKEKSERPTSNSQPVIDESTEQTQRKASRTGVGEVEEKLPKNKTSLSSNEDPIPSGEATLSMKDEKDRRRSSLSLNKSTTLTKKQGSSTSLNSAESKPINDASHTRTSREFNSLYSNDKLTEDEQQSATENKDDPNDSDKADDALLPNIKLFPCFRGEYPTRHRPTTYQWFHRNTNKGNPYMAFGEEQVNGDHNMVAACEMTEAHYLSIGCDNENNEGADPNKECCTANDQQAESPWYKTNCPSRMAYPNMNNGYVYGYPQARGMPMTKCPAMQQAGMGMIGQPTGMGMMTQSVQQQQQSQPINSVQMPSASSTLPHGISMNSPTVNSGMGRNMNTCGSMPQHMSSCPGMMAHASSYWGRPNCTQQQMPMQQQQSQQQQPNYAVYAQQSQLQLSYTGTPYSPPGQCLRQQQQQQQQTPSQAATQGSTCQPTPPMQGPPPSSPYCAQTQFASSQGNSGGGGVSTSNGVGNTGVGLTDVLAQQLQQQMIQAQAQIAQVQQQLNYACAQAKARHAFDSLDPSNCASNMPLTHTASQQQLFMPPTDSGTDGAERASPDDDAKGDLEYDQPEQFRTVTANRVPGEAATMEQTLPAPQVAPRPIFLTPNGSVPYAGSAAPLQHQQLPLQFGVYPMPASVAPYDNVNQPASAVATAPPQQFLPVSANGTTAQSQNMYNQYPGNNHCCASCYRQRYAQMRFMMPRCWSGR